jgi:hypothetical protein
MGGLQSSGLQFKAIPDFLNARDNLYILFGHPVGGFFGIGQNVSQYNYTTY